MGFVLARFRMGFRALLLTLVTAMLAGGIRAQTNNPGDNTVFRIVEQDAASGLADFSAQSHLQLLFDYDAVQGIRTRAIDGPLTARQALSQLLRDTGLAFTFVNARTISIVRDVSANAAPGPAAEPAPALPLPPQPPRPHALPFDEVVVTAEKREEALQRSALAVTALLPQVIERQQPNDLRSVITLIPNLQIGTSSTQAAYDLAMRGIVSTNRTEVGDAAVAFHVDGFYSPRPQGATMLIHDLDRLEALRGPQGTLFGRNANAGVINVVTAKPVFDAFSGGIDVTLGDYDLRRVKGHLNAPVGDTAALRAAAFVEQRDGYIEFLPGSNATSATPRYDDSDRLALRISGLWEPNSEWSVFTSAERFADRGAGTIPVSLRAASGHDLRSALISAPGELDLKNDTVHLRADYRPGAFELSYLFGWARMTRENTSDQDVGLAMDPELRALPVPPLPASYNEERRTVASEFVSTQHEFQMKPFTTERLDWILGAFFYEENNSIRYDVDVHDDRGGVPGILDAGDVRYSQSFLQPDRTLSAWAGFGQLTWHATSASRLSAGARYTQDTKRDRGGINLVCPAVNATVGSGGFMLMGIDTADIPFSPDPDSAVPVPGTCRVTAHNDIDKEWSKVTYMARAEYDLSAELLAYALTSTGFKSGVIQDGGTFANPEEVVNYELGLKATLLDGTMTLNTVGFYSDYSDILRTRVETDASGFHQTVTRNATRAAIVGIESELLWMVSPDDRLQGVLTYLNAEYRDYQTVDFQYYVPADPLTPLINLRGNKLPFAPEFTAALVFEHSFKLTNGASLVPRLQTKYQSEMFLTDFNRPSDGQEAYTRTDVGLRYEAQGPWTVEAFVLNVEDAAVKNNVDLRGNQPGIGGIPGFPGVARAFFDAPRTYGLRAAFRFAE